MFVVDRKKGLKTRLRRFLFGMTLAMFIYATVYLCLSIASLILFIREFFRDAEARGNKDDAIACMKLFNAIGLINVHTVHFVL